MKSMVKFAIEQQRVALKGDYWEEFQETTKINPLNILELGAKISSLRKSPFLVETVSKSYKNYSNCPQIQLPKANLETNSSLEKIVLGRRSVRQYTDFGCSTQDVANVLQLSYGISGVSPFNTQQYYRVTPSAGALYPLEIYLCAWNVNGLPMGIYHYRVAKHTLELIKSGPNVKADFAELGDWGGIEMSKSAFIILISAIFERCTFKYGNRGYRFSLIEVGCLSMIMNLIAEAMGMGVCHLGGFYDDHLNEYIGVDGITESVQTVLTFGQPQN
jgi:SagB-type dehydrogenase family enzyme